MSMIKVRAFEVTIVFQAKRAINSNQITDPGAPASYRRRTVLFPISSREK